MKTIRTHNASIWKWAFNGFAVGMMITAAVNAASYLFRSDSILNLVGPTEWRNEAVGFPMVLWRQGQTYGGYFVDYSAMGINVVAGSIIGATFAVMAIANRIKLEEMIHEFEHSSKHRPPRSIQFSIRGLMYATAIASLVLAAATHWSGTSELLWFAYVLGPVAILGIAFVPRKISWRERVVIVSVVSLIVIGGVIWTAHLRQMEFDKVLLGIFVFWTPQSAFAAVALTSYLVYNYQSKASSLAPVTRTKLQQPEPLIAQGSRQALDP